MITAKKIIQRNEIEVRFDWNESCQHVYKTFDVFINSKKSNIRGLTKYLSNKSYPSILTVSTYFWKPAQGAWRRRSNEKTRCDEVRQYFLKEGFAVNGEVDIKVLRKQKIESLLD